MIARDEYALKESYIGEKEGERKKIGEDEKGSDSETLFLILNFFLLSPYHN